MTSTWGGVSPAIISPIRRSMSGRPATEVVQKRSGGQSRATKIRLQDRSYRRAIEPWKGIWPKDCRPVWAGPYKSDWQDDPEGIAGRNCRRGRVDLSGLRACPYGHRCRHARHRALCDVEPGSDRPLPEQRPDRECLSWRCWAFSGQEPRSITLGPASSRPRRHGPDSAQGRQRKNRSRFQ